MSYRFIIATGGTGGHIFPALSLLRELEKKDHKCFILADSRFLRFKDKFPPLLNYHIVPSSALSGDLLNKSFALVKIVLGISFAMFWIVKNKPKMVISFGGYPSFPTMAAAVLLGVPLMIHEQNAVIGRANKLFVKFASIISLPFKNVKGFENVDQSKLHVVGNPVDADIAKVGKLPFPSIQKGGKINILILGGSQGAKILSKIIPEAIASMDKSSRERLSIVQQSVLEDVASVEKIYSDLSIEHVVKPFFTDIPDKLQDAHLVIGRSGAATVSELIASGRPSILVPIAISNENHQFLNARILEEVGGAWIIEEKQFTAENLNKKLIYLLSNTDSLKKASVKARSLFVDSNKNMIQLIEKFCAKDK